MFPPGNASASDAVAAHLRYRAAPWADLIGPLVVADQRLAEVSRALGEQEHRLPVSVINTSGAGGLVSLAPRGFDNLQIVAVESALRDLDDLVGNARRIAAAATELDASITVFVELPDQPGWERAVEEVEAAGLNGKIRTGGLTPTDFPSAETLARQLQVLIEADLPFKATAGLHHAWPNVGRNERGESLPQHGFASILVAVAALIDDAEVDQATALLSSTDHDQLTEIVGGWDESTEARVRRRFRSFGCCGVTDPIDDLVTLDLIEVFR